MICMMRTLFLTMALAASALATGALAQAKGNAQNNSPLAGFGAAGNKEPYKIDANRLEVQQAANKATYSGDVIATQGKMTMRCVSLVIFFNSKNADGAQPASAPAAPGAGGLKRLECHGPVTVTQEKQSATSKLLVFENDLVTMTGDVILQDGDNIQACEKLVYNTKTQIGRMEGRCRGIFLPGSDGGKPKPKT